MTDFSGFGTEAMTPAVAAPKLPSLPKFKLNSGPAPSAPRPSTDSVEPPGNDDFPKIEHGHPLKLQTQPPPGGDEQMELDPYESFPIPSTPNQGTPGDDQMNGPMFGNGVRSAAATTPSGTLNSRATAAQAPADVRAAIEKVAAETGASVPYLLATAQRESSFNPNEGGLGSIAGLYQATGGLRKQYGIEGDAEGQTRGYAAYLRDMRRDMAQRMGRTPTDAETYLGHHFGPSRGASIASGAIDPNTPVDQVFTPNELRGNPHIVKAGTIGRLKDVTLADMERRMSGFTNPSAKINVPQNGAGDAHGDFSQFGAPAGNNSGNDRQGITPQDLDAAQAPPVLTGAWHPRNMEAFERGIMSEEPSRNIDDRRGEPPERGRDRANAQALRDFQGQRPQDRIDEDFSEFGEPTLSHALGVDHIDQTAPPAAAPQRLMGSAPYVATEPSGVRQIPPAALTQLRPLDEMAFRQWVKDNRVPFNPDAAQPDYDMRGFYQGLMQGDPRATSAVDPNDGRLHYTDTWKRPSHQTFSGGSQYAGPTAPEWTPDDKLVSPGGRILFDDRKQPDGGIDFGVPTQ